MKLPSKSSLLSKHTIQHYCRCRDEPEKVFPFQDCPDLKQMEVTVAPQSCSDQHPLFCPTNAPPAPCPTIEPITPVCNCNCTYPNCLPLKDVCKNQNDVSSATPSTPTPSTAALSTTTLSNTTPSNATPSNSEEPQTLTPDYCTEQFKSFEDEFANQINSTLSSIIALGNSSYVQNAEFRDLTESVKWLWLTMVCVLGLLVVVTVLQVALLLAVQCRRNEPNKKVDIVMLDEIIRPNVRDDDSISITNDMYGRF
jgi:hypothetical protein